MSGMASTMRVMVVPDKRVLLEVLSFIREKGANGMLEFWAMDRFWYWDDSNGNVWYSKACERCEVKKVDSVIHEEVCEEHKNLVLGMKAESHVFDDLCKEIENAQKSIRRYMSVRTDIPTERLKSALSKSIPRISRRVQQNQSETKEISVRTGVEARSVNEVRVCVQKMISTMENPFQIYQLMKLVAEFQIISDEHTDLWMINTALVRAFCAECGISVLTNSTFGDCMQSIMEWSEDPDECHAIKRLMQNFIMIQEIGLKGFLKVHNMEQHLENINREKKDAQNTNDKLNLKIQGFINVLTTHRDNYDILKRQLKTSRDDHEQLTKRFRENQEWYETKIRNDQKSQEEKKTKMLKEIKKLEERNQLLQEQEKLNNEKIEKSKKRAEELKKDLQDVKNDINMDLSTGEKQHEADIAQKREEIVALSAQLQELQKQQADDLKRFEAERNQKVKELTSEQMKLKQKEDELDKSLKQSQLHDEKLKEIASKIEEKDQKIEELETREKESLTQIAQLINDIDTLEKKSKTHQQHSDESRQVIADLQSMQASLVTAMESLRRGIQKEKMELDFQKKLQGKYEKLIDEQKTTILKLSENDDQKITKVIKDLIKFLKDPQMLATISDETIQFLYNETIASENGLDLRQEKKFRKVYYQGEIKELIDEKLSEAQRTNWFHYFLPEKPEKDYTKIQINLSTLRTNLQKKISDKDKYAVLLPGIENLVDGLFESGNIKFENFVKASYSIYVQNSEFKDFWTIFAEIFNETSQTAQDNVLAYHIQTMSALVAAEQDLSFVYNESQEDVPNMTIGHDHELKIDSTNPIHDETNAVKIALCLGLQDEKFSKAVKQKETDTGDYLHSYLIAKGANGFEYALRDATQASESVEIILEPTQEAKITDINNLQELAEHLKSLSTSAPNLSIEHLQEFVAHVLQDNPIASSYDDLGVTEEQIKGVKGADGKINFAAYVECCFRAFYQASDISTTSDGQVLWHIMKYFFNHIETNEVVRAKNLMFPDDVTFERFSCRDVLYDKMMFLQGSKIELQPCGQGLSDESKQNMIVALCRGFQSKNFAKPVLQEEAALEGNNVLKSYFIADYGDGQGKFALQDSSPSEKDEFIKNLDKTGSIKNTDELEYEEVLQSSLPDVEGDANSGTDEAIDCEKYAMAFITGTNTTHKSTLNALKNLLGTDGNTLIEEYQTYRQTLPQNRKIDQFYFLNLCYFLSCKQHKKSFESNSFQLQKWELVQDIFNAVVSNTNMEETKKRILMETLKVFRVCKNAHSQNFAECQEVCPEMKMTSDGVLEIQGMLGEPSKQTSRAIFNAMGDELFAKPIYAFEGSDGIQAAYLIAKKDDKLFALSCVKTLQESPQLPEGLEHKIQSVNSLSEIYHALVEATSRDLSTAPSQVLTHAAAGCEPDVYNYYDFQYHPEIFSAKQYFHGMVPYNDSAHMMYYHVL